MKTLILTVAREQRSTFLGMDQVVLIKWCRVRVTVNRRKSYEAHILGTDKRIRLDSFGKGFVIDGWNLSGQ